ncbi:MAG: hypothetical protein A2X49_01100 [Lentisphaerae bacterium GWF2_52_8]|nr:MAG: hypothetical protein A2X49_01100 [Lentisphaerae bacterium GWF2_52_8]
MLALIRFETRKVISQNKCLLGFFTIVMMNVIFVLGFFIKQNKPGHLNRMLGPELLKELFNTCVYVQTILSPCSIVIFPVLVSVIVSYVFAGEYEIGSLRLTMVRPVSRLRILMAKWCAVSIYLGLLLVMLLVTGILFSLPFMKASGSLIIIGDIFSLPQRFIVHAEGFESYSRIFFSYLLAWPMLLSISCMSFMFATMTRNFALSAILSSTVYLSCYVASLLPFLSGIHPFLPTRYMPFWKYVMLEKIPWDGAIFTDAIWTLAFSLVFFIIAAIFYEKNDF